MVCIYYIFSILAHCCYSCRAFFRRTVLRVQKKGLKRCKTGRKDCDVNTVAKNCIHCRYTKCLKIGMTPELLQGKRTKVEESEEENEEEEEKLDVVSHFELPELPPLIKYKKQTQTIVERSLSSRGNICSSGNKDSYDHKSFGMDFENQRTFIRDGRLSELSYDRIKIEEDPEPAYSGIEMEMKFIGFKSDSLIPNTRKT